MICLINMSKIYNAPMRAEEAGLVVRYLERLSTPIITSEAEYLQHLGNLFVGTRVEALAREAESLLPTCFWPAPIEPAVRRMRQNAITYGYINEKLALTPLARTRIGKWYSFKQGLPYYQAFAETRLDRIVQEEVSNRAKFSKIAEAQQGVQMTLF